MIPDRLLLTPEGEASLLNAEQGGIFIRPRSFSVGNFSGAEPNIVAGSLLGDEIFSGQLYYVEVLNGSTARFTVQVPRTVDTVSITELIVWLDDGVPLGRVRCSVPYEKHANRQMRLEFLLHLTEDRANLIDVTLSSFGSVPSVSTISSLPPAITAITNAVVVLDLQSNGDGEFSPELAYRSGAGGSSWSFSGYNRLFSGQVTATDPARFTQDDVVTDFDLQTDDLFIVNVSAGKGAGESRRFKLIANEFVAVDVAFTDLDGSSVVHIWKQIVGTNSVLGLPDRTGISPDWVLHAGDPLNLPHWGPQRTANARSRGNIYHPPGKLKITPISITPNESVRTFQLYSEDPLTTDLNESLIHLYSYRKNAAYSMIALGGITQEHTAYNVTNNLLEFSEPIPLSVSIDARLFELEPHSGSALEIASRTYVGDGATREFDLPAAVTSSQHVFAYFERLLIQSSAYGINISARKLVFLEAPGIGMTLEINCLVFEDRENFSTMVNIHREIVTDNQNVFVLPFTPSSKELLFVSEMGAHYYKNEYVVVGNKVVMSSSVAKGHSVEFLCFTNIRAEGTPDTALRGLVYDAHLTHKYIELLRSGYPSLKIPLPQVNLVQGKNMLITGEYPNFQIDCTISEKSTDASFNAISASKMEKDVSELTFTQRIETPIDVLIDVNAHFEAKLGPGFRSNNGGLEEMEFVVGFKTLNSSEPEFGRNLKGTGSAGFGVSDPNATGVLAFSNGSIGNSINVVAANNKQKYIELVVKMRVKNASVANYGSLLRININGTIVPRL